MIISRTKSPRAAETFRADESFASSSRFLSRVFFFAHATGTPRRRDDRIRRVNDELIAGAAPEKYKLSRYTYPGKTMSVTIMPINITRGIIIAFVEAAAMAEFE